MRNSNHITTPWLSTLGTLLQGWQRALQYHRRRRAAIRELRALDNQALRDIGLERSQISTVVEGLLASEAGATDTRGPWRAHPLPNGIGPGLRGRPAEFG